MLQNVYLLAKIGADTAENERHFAENLQRMAPKNFAHFGVRAAARFADMKASRSLQLRGPDDHPALEAEEEVAQDHAEAQEMHLAPLSAMIQLLLSFSGLVR